MKMKKCPFCGGEAILDGKSDDVVVRCLECGTRGKMFFFDSENDIQIAESEKGAIEAWNARATDSAADARNVTILGRMLAEAADKYLDCAEEAWACVDADHISAPCYERMKTARDVLESLVAERKKACDPAAESLDLIADAKRQGRDPDDMVMLNRQQTRIIELVASSKKLAEALRLASLDCCPDMKIVGEDLVPCSEYLTKDNWCASCIARAALKDWEARK